MRIVLDTNCLIQSLSPHSAFFPVWESLLSEAIVNTIANAPFVLHVDPTYRFNLIQTDPDDNKFVDCAVIAGARYIVTNDHHFNILREVKFPLIQIITLKDFLCLLNSQRS